MRSKISVFIHFIFSFLFSFLLNVVVVSQERMENPFIGKELIVVTDGKVASCRALAVLLGIKELPVSAVLVSDESAWDERISEILKECGVSNIPVYKKWNEQIAHTKLVVLCLQDYADLSLTGIPHELIDKIVCFEDESLKIQELPPCSIDIIRPIPGMNLVSLEIEQLNQVETVTGRVFNRLISDNLKPEKELLPIYLLYPELFDMKPELREPRIVRSVGYDASMMKTVLLEVLAGEYRMGEGVAFAGFPVEKSLYKQDVRCMMDTAIARYGLIEWKACVLTDEIHGHLGIYSIVGAKMGIRAMEYFGVGQDQLTVVTYAGSKPPVSCLNDGIQVSTGATVGQGTIRVVEGTNPSPYAEFEYQGKKIGITIRDEYLKQIESDISRGVAQYGLLNAGYWKLIRNLSLQYWRDWNRKEIFVIEQKDNK